MLDTISLTLNDRLHTLRPTFAALMAIEKALDCRLLKLAARVSEGDVGTEDVLTILEHGLMAGSGPVSRETLQQAMVQSGFLAMVETCSRFLETALQGPQKPVPLMP